MTRRGNIGYGQRIADAVLNPEDTEARALMTTTWLDSWIQPAPARDRACRWLSMWLKPDLKNIPPEQVARYLREMATDVIGLGSNEAVDQFIDKILPSIVSNAPAGLNLTDE